MKDITNIILENESFIYSIASKFAGYKDKEDLFQAGCIGMIKAYNNFDLSYGVKFTTYAYQYVYGEIREFVNNDHNIKLNRDMSRLRGKIEEAKNYLIQYLSRVPSSKDLSDYLEIDEDLICQILNYKETYSMDMTVQDDLSLNEVIPDKCDDVDVLITLKWEIEKLDEPDRTIMKQKFFEDMTQSQIAYNLGLSQVDVSRREKKVLSKIRKSFNV